MPIKLLYMNLQVLRNSLFALLSSFIFSPIWAQNASFDQVVSNWFLEERFIIADKNDDALLEREEMEAFAGEFVYYLSGRNYSLTDRNRDGFLSFNEMFARTRSEYMFRYNAEQRQLRNLRAQYSFLQNPDIVTLKANPELVKQLFTNLSWMYNFADVATALYMDKAWMNANPGVKLSLHKNLRWMAANPEKAKEMYRDRYTTQQLPELLAWRADHKDFFRKYPRLDHLYLLEFFPSEILLNR